MPDICISFPFRKICLYGILICALSSCSLKDNPDTHTSEVLEISKRFQDTFPKVNGNYKTLELPYKKVNGKEVPISELKYWRGIQRLFFVPDENLKTQDYSGFSVHTMLFYNRRRAQKVFRSFCQKKIWQENQLLSSGSRIYQLRTAIIYINQEEGLKPEVWNQVTGVMDKILEGNTHVERCTCTK